MSALGRLVSMTCWPGSGSIPAGAPVAAPRPPSTARPPPACTPHPADVRAGRAGHPRPGKYDVWRPVRYHLAHLGKRKSVLIVLVTAVALALVGTTVGYAALSKSHACRSTARPAASTSWARPSATCWRTEDIELGEHDVVAPGLDETVDDGPPSPCGTAARSSSRSTAAPAPTGSPRPTSTSALAQIGLRFGGADLSASRSAAIDREGMGLDGRDPQDPHRQGRRRQDGQDAPSPRSPSSDALARARRRGRQERPRQAGARSDGSTTATRIVFTEVRVARSGSTARASTSTPSSARTPRCTRARPRRPRRRDRRARRDLPARLPQRQAGHAQGAAPEGAPRAGRRDRQGRHQGGTGDRRTSPAAAASGTARRSASPAATGPSTPATATTAACSSTSAPGRRTAAPACPSQHSRETQIAVADQVRDARGGYGAWPRCAAAGPAPLTTSARRPRRTTRLTPCDRPTPPPPGRGFSGRRTCVRWRHALDLRPTKQRGQNFVIDANTVRRIVRESGVDRRRRGARGRPRARLADPGAAGRSPGAWSPSRSTRCSPRRCPATIATYAPDQADRFEVVHADALRVTEVPGPPPTALVANLPYNVSVPVLLHLLALLPSLRARAGDGAGRGRRPARRAARLARPTASRRSRPPGTPTYAGPARSAATCSGRRPTSTPGLVAWTRRDPPATTRHPRARCSRSSTPRSPSAARRCAARSGRWPAPPRPSRPRSPHAGVDPLARGEVARRRGVRPDRRGAAPR